MVRGFCIYRINNVTNKSLLRIMNKKQPQPNLSPKGEGE